MAAPGCSGDLFHGTDWATRCGAPPAACTESRVEGGGGGPAGGGGETSDADPGSPGGGGAAGGSAGAGAAGGAGACAPVEDCATPEDDDCNGLLNDGCAPTSYSLGQEPDTGAFSYFDEQHNVETTGSPKDNSKHAALAPGQLLDGVLGSDDYHDDLGSGSGYEWVGWAFEEVDVVFEFTQPRDIEEVVLGTLRRTAGNVFEASKVEVSTSTDGVTFAPATVFALADKTLPAISDNKRADISLTIPKSTARFVRVALSPGAGKWIFLDEVSFD